MPRIVIAAAGTGGHLYPAQTLARQLQQKRADVEILFIGSGLACSRFFEKERFAFIDIQSMRPTLRHPLHALWALSQMGRGALASFRPVRGADLVIGFGSYHTIPALLLAKRSKLVLYAADALPGRVIRLFSRFAQVTGVQFEAAQRYLKGHSVRARLPLSVSRVSQSEARARLGLLERPTLLVVGGSQGAQSINRACLNAAAALKVWQVLHLAGSAEQCATVAAGYRAAGIEGLVKPFESQMHLAWQAADLVVMRAGAASVAEQLIYTVPALLIPYPFAADDHQTANADVVCALGGGEKLLDCDLDHLGGLIASFGPEKLRSMRQALRAYAEQTTVDFSDVILDFAAL